MRKAYKEYKYPTVEAPKMESDPVEGGEPNEGKTPGGEEPNGGKSSGEDPNGGKPSGEDPNGGKPSGEDPNGGKPSGEDPNGGKPSGEDPNGGKPSGEDPNGGKPSGEDPNGGKQSGEDPNGGKPSREDPNGGKQSEEGKNQNEENNPLSDLKFDKKDLVYGLKDNGRLRAFEDKHGGRMMEEYLEEAYGDIYELSEELGLNQNPSTKWIELSKIAMNDAAKKGFKIQFNLTGFDNIEDVFNGNKKTGVTADELRYIQENWNIFKDIVKFYIDEIEVSPPWLD